MSYDQTTADLTRELQGAKADLAEALRRESVREKQIVYLEQELERITNHRDRLLAEKDVAWGRALEADHVVWVRADRTLLSRPGAWSEPLLVQVTALADGSHEMLFRQLPAKASTAPDQPMNHLTTNQEGGE